MKVVVVGGGLSGLAAAHRLLEQTGEGELDLTVLEASDRPGGILGTIERDGFVLETGPDSILSEKRAAIDLAGRLGITDRLIETNAQHRGAYVVHRGRLERVPEGFSLMAPSRWDAWLRSSIVSPGGRLRAAIEPWVPVRPRARGEESMGGFVRRRLGREVLERLAQPLVGGIYGGDPDRLSLEATMPRFVAMEREQGSVIRAMRNKRGRASDAKAGGARYGLFVAFDRGMQVLVDALCGALGDRLKTSVPVNALRRGPHGGWEVVTEGGVFEADRVLVAVPAWRAARLLTDHHRDLGDALDAIPYGSAATVTMAWPRAHVPHALDAFGFVVPSVERRSVLAATFSSVKWPGRAPDGEVLLRVFVGGSNAPDAAELSDEDLEAIARRDLRSLMGIERAPRFAVVTRYARAMPQYQVGHVERVVAIERMEAELPGLALTTNALRGVGIPDAIRAAEAAAERLLAG